MWKYGPKWEKMSQDGKDLRDFCSSSSSSLSGLSSFLENWGYRGGKTP